MTGLGDLIGQNPRGSPRTGRRMIPMQPPRSMAATFTPTTSPNWSWTPTGILPR